MQGPNHSDFLLSISLTLMTFGFSQINQVLACIAALLTIALTAIRIKQALQEMRLARRKSDAEKHFKK